MNLSQFSQSGSDYVEGEWTSSLHTGLSDKSLLKLKEVSLAPKISAEIRELLEKLNQNNSSRNKILKELIDKILSYSPVNRLEYLWYLKFTVTLILLKELPLSLCPQQGNLLTNVLSIPTIIWDGSPIMINYFASNLYDIFEDDMNMIFVTSQLVRSRLGFYLSIVMLWKSIYRCIDEDKKRFQFYPPYNLIEVIGEMKTRKLDTNFDNYIRFIIILSKLCTLLFHCKTRLSEYICYKEFFGYDLKLIESLRKFLEHIMLEAESMWRREKENLNILSIIELLQSDISDLDTLVHDLSP